VKFVIIFAKVVSRLSKEVLMYAQASLPAPLFDSLMPASDRALAVSSRKPTASVPSCAEAEGLLSLERLHERLALLAQLELPCSIVIASASRHLREVLIKTVELADDSLSIVGDSFDLRLRRPHIHTIWLVNQQGAEGGASSLDILHANGTLYASIWPAPGGGEIWRDIMDNPMLSLA
jgi:hypothetical protein